MQIKEKHIFKNQFGKSMVSKRRNLYRPMSGCSPEPQLSSHIHVRADSACVIRGSCKLPLSCTHKTRVSGRREGRELHIIRNHSKPFVSGTGPGVSLTHPWRSGRSLWYGKLWYWDQVWCEINSFPTHSPKSGKTISLVFEINRMFCFLSPFVTICHHLSPFVTICHHLSPGSW